MPKPTLDAFLRDKSVAFAKSEAVAARRRARRNPRLFLSELAAAARERPVVLAYASLGEEFTIRGLALGEGPLRAFEARLERGFFRLSDFLMARQGACHRFEAHGRSPVAGPDAALPLPVEDPFEQDATACRADRDAARDRSSVRGREPTAKDPGHGPITLRLRDFDLADVFQALAAVGAGSFVVDEGVAGRTSVDVTRATLDETLAALRKSAGVEVADGGPVRRASRSASPQCAATRRRRAPRPWRASLSSARRCATCSRRWPRPTRRCASLGPPGYLGRVSVWTKDALARGGARGRARRGGPLRANRGRPADPREAERARATRRSRWRAAAGSRASRSRPPT